MPKKQRKKKRATKAHALYEVSGDKLNRKNRVCPKCGNAVFMAKHRDRTTCGHCGYTEFEKKS